MFSQPPNKDDTHKQTKAFPFRSLKIGEKEDAAADATATPFHPVAPAAEADNVVAVVVVVVSSLRLMDLSCLCSTEGEKLSV